MKQNPDFNLTHTERRKLRIKIAQHVLNMDALKNEMDRYNLPVLQKAASAGVNKKQRIKYAALVRQYELEKQAFIGGLARLAGKGLLSGAKMLGRGAAVGGRAGMAGARAAAPHVGNAMRAGAQMAGRGAMNAGKGIARMAGGAAKGGLRGTVSGVRSGFGNAIRGGLSGAGQGIAQAARANPMQALMGTGAIGAGFGTQIPRMTQGARRMGRDLLNEGTRELGGLAAQGQQGIDSAYENVGNFMNSIGQAGQDIYGGFQQAGNRF